MAWEPADGTSGTLVSYGGSVVVWEKSLVEMLEEKEMSDALGPTWCAWCEVDSS